jgi:hypothetical protein
LWFKGNPSRAGSAIIGAGPPHTATLRGAGTDIEAVGPGPYHDEFHYAYRRLKKDPNFGGFGGYGEIIARVESVDNTNAWAKAGVMFRETPFADSNFAMVVVTPGSGVSFQYRDTKRGAVTNQTIGGITPPHWVKLTRASIGSAFTAEHANDAEHASSIWNPVTASNVINIDMGLGVDNECLVGLCLTSHDAAVVCEADFSGVEINPLVSHSMASGPWRSEDVGIISNDPAPLYVALEDVNNNVGVKYYDEDANFSSVYLTNVDRVYIGLGNRDTPTSGGSGVLYLDDIRLYQSRFVPGYLPSILLANIFYDERVDGLDLDIMANDWLLADEVYPATDPGTANLVALYLLEGNVNDSWGSYHGTPTGSPVYSSTDYIEGGQAIDLDGTDDYVTFGAVGIDGNDPRTIAVWAKMGVPAGSMTGWTNVFGFTDPNSGGGRSFDIERRGGQDNYCLHVYGQQWNIMPLDQEWHHLAATFDVNTVAWYGDGLLVGTEVRDINTVDNVQMGMRADNTEHFNGLIDDARIYDRALTAPEVAHLVDLYDSSPSNGQLHIPVPSVANLYNDEPVGSQWVNFMDFAVLGSEWLEKEPLWP